MSLDPFIPAQLWWVVGLFPLAAVFYLLYFLVSLPLRRQERARFFIDLVESGLQQGRTLEHTVISISQTRDRSVGVNFHLLATYLESGWRFTEALGKTPRLVSPQVLAMLKVGEEIGDVRKVLPACRALLKDASSQTQSAYNYLIALAFVVVPIIPSLFWMLTTFVYPRLQTVFADLTEGVPLPSVPLFEAAGTIAKVQLVLSFVFFVGAIFYVGGPRLASWLEAGFSVRIANRFIYWIPWRRKRLLRDFSTVLALLLDEEVPEDRAVRLAAESTANRVFVKRAERVVGALSHGTNLPEAMQYLDASAEFRWRLSNALHAERRFFAALRAWLEALDAKAFQQEQSVAHFVTTSLVLVNGLMVGALAVFVFGALTFVLDQAGLW